MKRFYLCGVALLALAACSPGVPDSGSGVGFSDYGSYQMQQEQAARNSQAGIQAPVAVDSSTLDAEAEFAARAAAANSGQVPVQASPENPAPEVVENAAGLSEETDFTAVSEARSIKDDAALIAQNRAQYQVIAPTALPDRPAGTEPNIVAYALGTSNPIGVQLYKRSGFGAASRYERACAAYASADRAQEAFLSMGGPEKDRKGMDPDGDGYACGWDPAPFRTARNG